MNDDTGFTFTHHDRHGTTVTHTFKDICVPEIVTQFIFFLRGCGYSLPNSDGYLEFMDEEDATDTEVEV